MLHDVGRFRFGQFAIIDADFFEQPTWSAVAAGHSAPNVLMEIDENVEAIIARDAAQLGKIVEVRGVVVAGATMLDGFPGRQQAKAIEAPRAKPGEMFGGFRDREWASSECHLA